MVIQVKVTLVAVLEVDERAYPRRAPHEIVTDYRTQLLYRLRDPDNFIGAIDDLAPDLLEFDIQCIDPTPFVGSGAKGAGNDR